MINTRSFAKHYQKLARVVHRRLTAVINDVNEENVHRLRTGIRRLNACLELLPRSMRDQKRTRKLDSRYSKLLKLSAKVRDTDIMFLKLSNFKANTSIKPLLAALRSSRNSQLEAVREMAEAGRRLDILRVRAGDLSDPKLRKRFDKIVYQLSSKIAEALPIVLNDPAKIEKLHVMRIDCKRLRYTLELDRTKKTLRLLSILESWQELLGSIHDNDIMIDYLRRSEKLPQIQRVLEGETKARIESYKKFGLIAVNAPLMPITP